MIALQHFCKYLYGHTNGRVLAQPHGRLGCFTLTVVKGHAHAPPRYDVCGPVAANSPMPVRWSLTHSVTLSARDIQWQVASTLHTLSLPIHDQWCLGCKALAGKLQLLLKSG